MTPEEIQTLKELLEKARASKTVTGYEGKPSRPQMVFVDEDGTIRGFAYTIYSATEEEFRLKPDCDVEYSWRCLT